MTSTQELLDACTIEEKLVRLPRVPLNRKGYLQVAIPLEGIGGKWNPTHKGFLFAYNPSELLGRLQKGEKINLKKEYQFYPTPSSLARYLVELAEIEPADHILEPSAGQGHILDLIREHPSASVECCELMPQNQQILHQKGYLIQAADFLSYMPDRRYSKIIANPPFSNHQDLTHIEHMYRLLAGGGRLVSILSKNWKRRRNQHAVVFREWLSQRTHKIQTLPQGLFKESGTLVGVCIVVIDKPLHEP